MGQFPKVSVSTMKTLSGYKVGIEGNRKKVSYDTLSPQYPLLNFHLLWLPSYSVIAWIEAMLERDVNDNRKIGNYGAQHILSGVPRDSVTILTHCNTGSLATAGYGTALGKTGAVGVNEKRGRLFK